MTNSSLSNLPFWSRSDRLLLDMQMGGHHRGAQRGGVSQPNPQPPPPPVQTPPYPPFNISLGWTDDLDRAIS